MRGFSCAPSVVATTTRDAPPVYTRRNRKRTLKDSTTQGFRRRLARANRYGLNRVTRRLFPHIPAFGVIEHRGRRSGKLYWTPVNVFEHPDRFVVALTYGSDTDWVKNVVRAGACALTTRGDTYQLHSPRIFRDESRRDIRRFERSILEMLHVVEFLELMTAASG